jgi:hypothetical protein
MIQLEAVHTTSIDNVWQTVSYGELETKNMTLHLSIRSTKIIS